MPLRLATSLVLAAAALLAACVPSEPLVTDYNGASLKLTMTNFAGEGVISDATNAKALTICQSGGKRRTEYASSRMVNDYQIEHLYLCL